MIPGMLKLITAPTEEPVTASEAKSHLRVVTTAEDTDIARYIQVARDQVEMITRRALVTQTWELVLQGFPASNTIKLPKAPLQSVTSIKYTSLAGVESTFAANNYLVDTVSQPGQIRLRHDKSWPGDDLQEINGVVIRFVAGYGAAAAVPVWAKQAILLYVGDLYENREDTLIAQGVSMMALPNGVASLISGRRVDWF